jgi:hypothetical protein
MTPDAILLLILLLLAVLRRSPQPANMPWMTMRAEARMQSEELERGSSGGCATLLGSLAVLILLAVVILGQA